MRVGIDVGGTNADAVLLNGTALLGKVKTPTTSDVTTGIVTAVDQLLDTTGVERDQVTAVMIGTTHFANAIVDQFADARYIRDRLAARETTKPLTVVQLPRAEANLAVAAASVLARDRFLGWLERASRDYGLKLPKGASDEVEAAARRLVQSRGQDALAKVAKLHFKTTQRVLNHQPRLAAP